jgi:aminoglycoside 6'-N-acetyltransferase I
MQIVELRADDESALHQVATLLVEGFATNWPDAWPDMDSAVEEVQESFAAGRINRVARDEDGTVLGWIGGISQYDGHVWELHPLVVRVSQQGKGIGRALDPVCSRLPASSSSRCPQTSRGMRPILRTRGQSCPGLAYG